MLRLTRFALTIIFFLLASGCEYSLEAPVNEEEVRSDRAVTAAHIDYTDMSRSTMEAKQKANEIAHELTSPLRLGALQRENDGGQQAGATFQSIDQKARSLIDAHRDKLTGPPLARNISFTMLKSGLLGVSGREALSEDVRQEAIAYYARTLIENKGTDFDLQIRALKTLGPERSAEVKTLAQSALSNLEGFRKALQQPVEIPHWVKEEATAGKLKDIRQRAKTSRQERLQWLRENPVHKQLAALAGKM